MAFMNEVFEDWDDDERMRMLFSDFRPKHVNPEGWMNKMNTWVSSINSWCSKKHKAVFSADDLRCAFERKGLQPQCLEQVLQHMNREGSLVERDKYSGSCGKQGWLGWGMDLFVKQPISWGWSIISKSIYGPTESSPQQFVQTSLLQEICSSVLERIEPEVDFETPTMSVTKCQNLCKDLCDVNTFPLVFSQLKSQQKVSIFTESGIQYIKVHTKPEETATVTETDVGFVRLQKTLQKVEGEIEKLRGDMESYTQQAKVALKAGQKTKASAIIRRRKVLEKTVDQKTKTAEQLEGMILRLQNSSSDQEVIGALKAGLNAQKSMTAKGMNADSVGDTMANIQDAFDEQEEIAQAMSSPVVGFPLSSDEDSALEQELDDLLELEREKHKADARRTPKKLTPTGFDLPEVPESNPSPPHQSVQSRVSQQI